MVGSRGEFSSAIKENLAKRAGQRCSNCAVGTSGPHENEDKAINVGVAAHITAASPGGPRYNKFLTSAQRAAITNAIWLCQKCAKLIDSDVTAYPEEMILQWKRHHEAAIKAAMEGGVDLRNNARLPAQLSIDAVFSHPSADNKACVLDIRVSNPGGSDLMINAVQFQVLETVEQMLLGNALYSAQYDLNIGELRDHASQGECQVAQILKPGEADRFAIVLSAPKAVVTVGGWRFATLFKTNAGNVPGPEIEVWLPQPEVIRSFDQIANSWLMRAQLQNFFTDKEFQTLAVKPTDPENPNGTTYSKFLDTGGGALAYPSTTGGYETFVTFDVTIAWYRGPHPLWERSGNTIAETEELEVKVAKLLHQTWGAEALEKTESRCAELAKEGNAKAVEKWQRVLENVKLLTGVRA
jgi:hypothetical protein